MMKILLFSNLFLWLLFSVCFGQAAFAGLIKKFREQYEKALTKEFGATKPDENSEALRSFANRHAPKNQSEIRNERLKISEAIRALALGKGFALIFDRSRKLPAELEKYPLQDITKEFISYYNQIKPNI
jgi:hypothetical protein